MVVHMTSIVIRTVTIAESKPRRLTLLCVLFNFKLQGKENRLSFQQTGEFADRNAGNGKAGCKSCILEIPRDCTMETGTKYIVSG